VPKIGETELFHLCSEEIIDFNQETNP